MHGFGLRLAPPRFSVAADLPCQMVASAAIFESRTCLGGESICGRSRGRLPRLRAPDASPCARSQTELRKTCPNKQTGRHIQVGQSSCERGCAFSTLRSPIRWGPGCDASCTMSRPALACGSFMARSAQRIIAIAWEGRLSFWRLEARVHIGPRLLDVGLRRLRHCQMDCHVPLGPHLLVQVLGRQLHSHRALLRGLPEVCIMGTGVCARRAHDRVQRPCHGLHLVLLAASLRAQQAGRARGLQRASGMRGMAQSP